MFHCGLTVWRLSTWSDETLPNEKSMKHKAMKLSGTRSVHVKKSAEGEETYITWSSKKKIGTVSAVCGTCAISVSSSGVQFC